LQSEFDDEIDDYSTSYSVFALPDSVGNSVQAGNWDSLNKTSMTEIGQIPVSSVTFDPTKRKELDASVLDDLLVDD